MSIREIRCLVIFHETIWQSIVADIGTCAALASLFVVNHRWLDSVIPDWAIFVLFVTFGTMFLIRSKAKVVKVTSDDEAHRFVDFFFNRYKPKGEAS